MIFRIICTHLYLGGWHTAYKYSVTGTQPHCSLTAVATLHETAAELRSWNRDHVTSGLTYLLCGS